MRYLTATVMDGVTHIPAKDLVSEDDIEYGAHPDLVVRQVSQEDFISKLPTLKQNEMIWALVDDSTYNAVDAEYGINA